LSHIPFGKLIEPDTETLMGKVSGAALNHAGVSRDAVDGIYVGVFNNGFDKQDFQGALVALSEPELAHTPATRLENACATGSAALYAAADFIESGRGRVALVVGAEKMTSQPNPVIGDILLNASYRKEEADVEGGFAGVFGGIARAYFERYGDYGEELARIAAKNHRNGVDNPYAQMRKDLGYEFCREVSDKNPYVAAPLRRTDCSLVTDGAAAVVLADVPTALGLNKAVFFRAAQQVNDFLPMRGRDMSLLEGGEVAWKRAFVEAGVTLDDLSFVETHDCFTSAELIEYEIMGLTPRGQGFRAIEEGWVEKDGRLPVNVSGGLKAKGHPIGATGVSMHALTAMQLVGEAPGGMQLPKADIGAVFNMGGAAVANYV
jgi:acetyl-CoA C-acetyltransferase